MLSKNLTGEFPGCTAKINNDYITRLNGGNLLNFSVENFQAIPQKT
jgi:hypothetical protein